MPTSKLGDVCKILDRQTQSFRVPRHKNDSAGIRQSHLENRFSDCEASEHHNIRQPTSRQVKMLSMLNICHKGHSR
jgi:hypothetical protein